MTANVIVTVEREFDYPRSRVFRAWTEQTEANKCQRNRFWGLVKVNRTGFLVDGYKIPYSGSASANSNALARVIEFGKCKVKEGNWIGKEIRTICSQ